MDYSNRSYQTLQRDHDDWDQVHNDWLSVQTKKKSNTPEIVPQNDTSEKEADDVAAKVVDGQSVDLGGMIGGNGGTVQRDGTDTPTPPENFNTNLSNSKGSGASLDASTQSEMESKMGADFSGVNIHTGSAAAGMAGDINAKAFTHGQDIYFGKGQYNPQSKDGKTLLAHELTHTVQQNDGVQTKIQRQQNKDKSNPKAIIPVRDLIKYIKAVEQAYPDDDWQKTLTRIRQEYYNGLLFEKLIPNAPIKDDVPSYDAPWTTGDRRRRALYGTDMEKVSGGKDAQQHLTAHADENSIQDNPSPYILLDNGEQVDLGHLLLGLDALIHPQVGIPYSTYSVPNIDPATFVADLGIAVVWMTTHEDTKKQHKDAPVKIDTPDLEQYYQMSAPEQDLLGDVDAFGLYQSIGKHNSEISNDQQFAQKLSDMLEFYYLKKAENKHSVDKRWQSFMERTKWKYTYSSGKVTLDGGVRNDLMQRVKYFSDMYDDGFGGTLLEVATVWDSPKRRTWKHADAVVDKFLTFLKTNLENELQGKHIAITPKPKAAKGGAGLTPVVKNAAPKKTISSSGVILTQDPGQYSSRKDNLRLSSETKVEIIDYGTKESFNQVTEQYRWYKVKVLSGTYTGKTGWVSATFLQ